LASFFAILSVYGFQKKFKIFVLFYSMDPRFFQKIIEIFMFFLFYGLKILSKNFGKSWNIFLKNKLT